MQPVEQPSALVRALIERMSGRLFIRPRESKQFFGWSRSHSYVMVARGELPPLRQIGSRYMSGWLAAEIIEHIARAPVSRLTGPRSPGRPRRKLHEGEVEVT